MCCLMTMVVEVSTHLKKYAHKLGIISPNNRGEFLFKTTRFHLPPPTLGLIFFVKLVGVKRGALHPSYPVPFQTPLVLKKELVGGVSHNWIFTLSSPPNQPFLVVGGWEKEENPFLKSALPQTWAKMAGDKSNHLLYKTFQLSHRKTFRCHCFSFTTTRFHLPPPTLGLIIFVKLVGVKRGALHPSYPVPFQTPLVLKKELVGGVSHNWIFTLSSPPNQPSCSARWLKVAHFAQSDSSPFSTNVNPEAPNCQPQRVLHVVAGLQGHLVTFTCVVPDLRDLTNSGSFPSLFAIHSSQVLAISLKASESFSPCCFTMARAFDFSPPPPNSCEREGVSNTDFLTSQVPWPPLTASSSSASWAYW